MKPFLLLLAALAPLSCAPSAAKSKAALTVTAAAKTLEANGTDATLITAALGEPESGVVVSFSSTGGLLSSSAAVPDAHGKASVTLLADREDALLGRAAKPVTVRATVTRTKTSVETATVDLTFTAPTTGAPSLVLTANPPAATADGTTPITIAIAGRRLAAGTQVTVATTAGSLSSSTTTLADDGNGGVSGSVTLTAPSSPATATVSARAQGTTAITTINFVVDGAPQFDLTGTWAQFTPARIKMTAGTLTPNPQCVVAPAYIKVDVTQTGDQVDATFTTCFVTLAPVKSIAGNVTDTAPPAFVSAIPPVHATFSLASVALGALFDPPQSIVVSGANLVHPTDALPTDPNDPRVVDSDGDGRPGVTVVNSLAGEQNITFRNTGHTKGKILSGNRVLGDELGDLTALPESSVLGVGNSFLPQLQNVPSTWEMVRVDGKNGSANMDTNGDGEVSCQEIVDAASFLFTLQPPSTPLDCTGVN
jgi:hypothetical protein